jgi:competence protein ComEC
LEYLRYLGVDDIEFMIASHADSDHIGGLIDVLEAPDIPVEAVLYNGYPGDTATWNNFVTAVNNEGISLTVSQFPITYTWGVMTAEVLNPVPGLSNPDQNEASVVILLDYGETEFMFTGDIGFPAEDEILTRYNPADLDADILKVSHHGSKYATGLNFLSAVGPPDAVISVGKNPYGHPAEETLQKLDEVGSNIWRTDEHGTIVFISNGDTYKVYTIIEDRLIFLPVIFRSKPTPLPTEEPPPPPLDTPTPTSTQTPTPTSTQTIQPPQPTATATSTPTPTPTEGTGTTGDIDIINIFYDGAGSQEPDEYVEIKNVDTKAIQLSGWTLRDIADHVYTFPNYVMQPGQVCRVYTNENHPEWCGFNYGSGSAIWNNSGDCAYLRDSQFTLIDEYCY